jgi:asparagine synthase (glutamine-hydrolysing)
MCGIAGIIGKVKADALSITRMLEAQRHRGPDALQWQQPSPNVLLGHNRLSIIDLNENANQPFTSADGRYSIVFNGEIYNYIELRTELDREVFFRTQSDTEVLLNAYIKWGSACLDKLTGMFAFAIWDNEKQQLFAARDRFGVKPLYYYMDGDTLIFSSEIKAIWAAGVPKKPNEDVWAAYFCYGVYGEPSSTFWEGINPLPAGYFMEWNDGTVTRTQWYDFTNRVQNTHVPTSEEEAEEIWTSLALDSVKLRFRSDVPVGFNLSGGLDSSLLLGLVARTKDNLDTIKAFHFYTGDDRYDELPWVKSMVAHTAVRLEPVKLSPEEVPSLATSVAFFEDEPFGGVPTLAFSQIFQQARKDGYLVLLDGQGIDESLAGYDYYALNSDSLIQGTNIVPTIPEYCSDYLKNRAVRPRFPQPFGDALLDKQYRDLFFTKIPRALRFNDRVSMMHGTELREPFLDHRLVEFGFALPAIFKIRDGQRKWLARRVAAKFMPADVSHAPKRPLQTPQREWLAEELASWTRPIFEQENNMPEEWIKQDRLKKVFSDYCEHRPDNSFYIWQYINAALLFES